MSGGAGCPYRKQKRKEQHPHQEIGEAEIDRDRPHCKAGISKEQERRQYELARHDYDKAIELEPGNADYYLSRGAFLLCIKKKKLARADFQKALECGASREDVAALLQQTR